MEIDANTTSKPEGRMWLLYVATTGSFLIPGIIAFFVWSSTTRFIAAGAWLLVGWATFAWHLTRGQPPNWRRMCTTRDGREYSRQETILNLLFVGNYWSPVWPMLLLQFYLIDRGKAERQAHENVCPTCGRILEG